jgi:hypothetical protein
MRDRPAGLWENVMREHPEFDHWAVRDLALAHYFGKWKAAKDHASVQFASYSHDWWMAARKHYLELGGEYKSQLPKASPDREEFQP